MRQFTRTRWELTHFVNVFFCTVSRSSAKRRRKNEKRKKNIQMMRIIEWPWKRKERSWKVGKHFDNYQLMPWFGIVQRVGNLSCHHHIHIHLCIPAHYFGWDPSALLKCLLSSCFNLRYQFVWRNRENLIKLFKEMPRKLQTWNLYP